MAFRTREFYHKYLGAYVLDHYPRYYESYITQSAINQWAFCIPELGLDILLFCHDDGEVVETRKRMDAE